ncbi:hypothetical protein [Streptomyces sp. MJP52]|uniref:hypothetical protein n=1 Tax=Streptomyces sp. MJP52 TaxID=2940555 RepID=UPI00247570AB|nr:hypothetical protein [Streptomyces sp. MJP52]MDH6224311.1 hypothetical protein [Streptomyces sp. MJP52]
MSSNPAKGPFVNSEPVRRHILNLMSAGASARGIADHCGVHYSILTGLLYDRSATRPRSKKIRLVNARLILSVRAEDVATCYVDPTGTQRRIQALAANGWPQRRLGPHLGLHPAYVHAVMRQPSVYGVTAASVAAAYDRLWNQDPRHHGISIGTITKVRAHARHNGWAPPGAWDDDTIDDPNAHPEWTGHCGTDRGYWIHRLQNLPLCERCEQAHTQWLAEHAHLDPKQRNQELFKARGSALSREADLAVDGRELISHGLTAEQAAARLGISKNYLLTTFRRYPADTEQELAA